MRAPDPMFVARFRADCHALVPPSARLLLAVSGGPDSLALLCLAAAAMPDRIAAATVDHGLRKSSGAEAAMVGSLCRAAGIAHHVLDPCWDGPPASAVPEKAREARYAALAAHARAGGHDAIVTAHHADDQAETVVMRLNRGSGVRGLSAIRPSATVPGDPRLPLFRPLLGWRKADLVAVCAQCGVDPADDPSNRDLAFERARVRAALHRSGLFDVDAIARSAEHLAAAERALDWAAQREWTERVTRDGDAMVYRGDGTPGEIRRRIVLRILGQLGSEGSDTARGPQIDRLMAGLDAGETATLRGVRCSTDGMAWRFAKAPARRPK